MASLLPHRCRDCGRIGRMGLVNLWYQWSGDWENASLTVKRLAGLFLSGQTMPTEPIKVEPILTGTPLPDDPDEHTQAEGEG